MYYNYGPLIIYSNLSNTAFFQWNKNSLKFVPDYII